MLFQAGVKGLVLSVLAAISFQAVADELNTDHNSLIDRVDSLSARMARLAQDTNDQWLTEHRAEEIRNLVAETLEDAESRSSLLGPKGEFGWDKGFFLQSPDGNFLLEISGQVQIRYTYSNIESESEDKNRGGFEVRRAKMKFDGHVINPGITYSIGGSFDRRTGAFTPQGINVNFELTDELALKIGRARSPLLKEEAVSSKRQLLIERSLIAKTFDQERTVGMTLKYQLERIRIFAGISKPLSTQTWLASTRAELLLIGEKWSQIQDYTSFRGEEPWVAIGAGVLRSESDPDDALDDDEQILRWTADLSVELGGVNFFAAVVGNHKDQETKNLRDQIGFVVQGGFFVTDNWELFAQYVWGDADEEAPDLSVITIGTNYYLASHTIKWTSDIGFGLNEVASFWASTGANWRTDPDGEDGQIVIRTQLQLLY